MPVFYQEEINASTKLGIWKIEEPESFFKAAVPQHRHVSHPHKRLQHLAGRFLLKYLFPQFPAHLIRIADTRKPYLPDEAYHFSISHCGDFAAAIVSKTHRVGIDIEIPAPKIIAIKQKFMSEKEIEILRPATVEALTQIWSAKEAVFKWYGKGEVDFKGHIQLQKPGSDPSLFKCCFIKTATLLDIHLKQFASLCLSYAFTPVS